MSLFLHNDEKNNFFILQAIMQEALEMDEIKFTSFSVWERRENPSEHWNDKS